MNLDQGGRNFSFIGVLLLAAFGAFLWETIPLESSRPTGERETRYKPEYKDEVPAKLWQDPFKAIFTDPDVKKAINEQALGNITECDFSKIAPDFIGDEDNEIRFLAAMVTLGSDAESEERRRRRRYAVLAGLGQAGYIPDNTSTIKFCIWKKEVERGVQNGSEMIVPYELYKEEKTSGKGRIMLLWLNESRFVEEPLDQFWSLIKQLVSARSPDGFVGPPVRHECHRLCTFFALGPARSQTLRNLVERTSERCKQKDSKNCPDERIKQLNIKGFHILSPTATAAGNQLFPSGADSNIEESDSKLKRLGKRFSPKNCTGKEGGGDEPCVSFLRTIQSDGALAKVLVGELEMRDVRPGKGKVVLLSEWDTFFGRSLPRSFELEYCPKKNNDEDKQQEESSSCKDDVLQRSYLRGIDGHYSAYKSTEIKDVNRAGNTANDLLSQNDSKIVRRPAGTGQFDYLRRLAGQLEGVDKKAKAENQKGIKAIGILGSDVYDKLLILRALRPQFPGVLFFTTDLDTQLLHPADYRWTRNLIIASSFDLYLNDNLQGKTPPFRNSYQTSVYLSTLLAAKYNYPSKPDGYRLEEINFEGQDAFFKQIPPLLFEVGRKGAVLLNQPRNAQEKISVKALHIQPKRAGFIFKNIIITFSVLVLFLIITQLLKPMPESFFSFIMILLVGLYMLVTVAAFLGQNEEPFSFTEGVSLWPTELIRFFSLCLSGYFIYKILFKDLQPDVEYETGNQKRSTQESIKNGMQPAAKHRRKFCPGFGVFPLYVCQMLLVFLFGLGGMGLTMLHVDLYYLFGYWLLVISFGRLIFQEKSEYKIVDNLLRKQTWAIEAYLSEYARLGEKKHRCRRSMVFWLLFLSMASLLFSLTGVPHVPYRGDVTKLFDVIILIASVFAMLFLVYLVIDAFRLCAYWIKGLSENRMDWSGAGLQRICQEHAVNPLYGVELLKIQLVAKYTEELCQLVYYPFLIIMLMLLSRSSYFDNWGLPQGIAIVIIINIFLLIGSGHILRQEAEKCRKVAVGRLRVFLVAISRGGDGDQEKDKPKSVHLKYKTTAKQVELLIGDIESIRTGAFQSFLEQPMVRASLILLGAIGLSVGEYLMLFR